MSNTYKNASSLTGAIKRLINNFLFSQTAKENIYTSNVIIDDEDLIKVIKFLLERNDILNLSYNSLKWNIVSIIENKSEAEKWESIFDSKDIVNNLIYDSNNLSLSSLRNRDENSIQELLKNSADVQSSEIIIALKKKGYFND